MTPNKQALQRLLDAVEAGETPNDDLIIAALGHRRIAGGWYVPRLVKWIMDPADIRAMGAAKALHDALVPGWEWRVVENRAWVWSYPSTLQGGDEIEDDGGRGQPARAWLIAIIRAVMAGER